MAVAPPRYYTYRKKVPLPAGFGLGFREGRGFYARPVVAHGPAPVLAAAPVDPYLAQAKAIAAALLDPQTAEANRAAEQAQRDALARAKAYEGVTTALGSFTKDLPAEVATGYRNAATDISGFAGGITGQAGENARAAAAEAAAHIAALNAPGSVEANPNYENTVAITGGFIPARSLAEQAAAHLAQMQGLRTASGLSVAQAAREQGSKDSAAVADLRARASALEGTRAGEVAKALLQLHDEARQQQGVDIQQRALQVQEGQLQLSRAKTALDEAQAMTNITGTLWVVKGGKAVNTGKVAPGTAGYRETHPTTTPAHLQASNIGGHPVSYDPNTGAYYLPGTDTPVDQATINGWLKNPASGSGKKGMQSKTINGHTVNYDPATGKYYDPATGKLVDPNSLKSNATKLSPEKTRQFRAKARNGIGAALKADGSTRPAGLYATGVAAGVPGWIMVQALREEAAHHPNDPAWQNVLKPGWAAGA